MTIFVIPVLFLLVFNVPLVVHPMQFKGRHKWVNKWSRKLKVYILKESTNNYQCLTVKSMATALTDKKI